MLDIHYLREHAQEVKDNLKKRNDPQLPPMVDEVLELDKEWREIKKEADQLRHERNKISSEINKAVKAGKPIDQLKKKAKDLPEQIQHYTEQITAIEKHMRDLLLRIPNMLHDSVPIGTDDSDNEEIKRWGKTPTPSFPLVSHAELLEQLGQADFDNARKTSGAGFVFILDKLAMLDLALQRFAIDHLRNKGFTLIAPPLMMRREAYEGVTDLGDFENVMYKIDNEDEYLIATSEHPIAARLMNDVLEEKELPLKFVGVSPCFRKEIGSHGIDTKGLFRMHQFNKVEQFIFCKPEQSWKLHEELQRNSEELFEALEIPYRVVNICTGDIGIVAAKKYDIEAWFPREETYREVTSCSNCTSYQAVRLNIRYQKGEDREYIHTLNNTAIATSRALRAIVEHYQQPDGTIKIPKVLQPYCGFDKIA
ncbi:serine--tRNA ligase [Candidatus Woesearchaeota archaeon]|nr:serine--tRNA ligase [Candidatus Woesearchaeota archaeon]